jgi:hypothetical protein
MDSQFGEYFSQLVFAAELQVKSEEFIEREILRIDGLLHRLMEPDAFQGTRYLPPFFLVGYKQLAYTKTFDTILYFPKNGLTVLLDRYA